jgi:hypothetical protein
VEGVRYPTCDSLLLRCAFLCRVLCLSVVFSLLCLCLVLCLVLRRLRLRLVYLVLSFLSLSLCG